MAESVEHYIDSCLFGGPLNNELAELCDFSLDEQNAALETQGITPRVDPLKQPILGDTVTYVVAAVIFNEQQDILMIQEAKEKCAGKWYLPAGRMEKGEDICKATEREVLEETGLQIKYQTLLNVESAKGSWFRFSSVCTVIGGQLKTPAQADSESIQAKWIANLSELTLRSRDIINLIDRAKRLVQARNTMDTTWHSDMLPNMRPYPKLLLRLIVVIRRTSDNKVFVLLSERTAWHLPTCEIHPAKSVHSTLRKFMVEIFGADVAAHRPHGLLSVELNTGKFDGLCLTMLVVFKASIEAVPIIGKYVWHEVSQKLSTALSIRVACKNSSIPFHVIN